MKVEQLVCDSCGGIETKARGAVKTWSVYEGNEKNPTYVFDAHDSSACIRGAIKRVIDEANVSDSAQPEHEGEPTTS